MSAFPSYDFGRLSKRISFFGDYAFYASNVKEALFSNKRRRLMGFVAIKGDASASLDLYLPEAVTEEQALAQAKELAGLIVERL